MKKIFALLFAIILVSGLVGCSGDKKSESGADIADESIEKIKLRLVTISGDVNQDTILADFIKANVETALPHIEVEYEPGGGGEDLANKMKTYNATNDLPDVWYSTADYAFPIVSAGNQLKLNEKITADGFIERYEVSDALKHFDGGIYAISSGADTFFTPRIFYNKEIFEQNNVEVPTTWDDFLVACETFKSADITPISMMGKGGWAPQLFLVQTMIQLHDPEVAQQLLRNETEFSNPVVIDAIKKVENLVTQGYFPADVANMDYGPALEMFTSGKSAMYWGFSWDVVAVAADPKIDLMHWPQVVAAVDPASVIQVWGSPLNGYTVNANSENVNAALELAEFCVSQEALYWASKGSVTNLNPGVAVSNQSDLMKKHVEMYTNAKTKINTIYLNAMDAKTAADYGLAGSNLLAGYTAEQYVEDFNKAWLDNKFFE